MLAFATSAVRDAANSAKVLKRVAKESGVSLNVLTGEDEVDVGVAFIDQGFRQDATGDGLRAFGAAYDEDFGYVISDTFRVTESGHEVFGKTPRKLFEIL